MLDSIAVTLATGLYADTAAAFLRSLALASNATLAVTDRPAAFAAGVETIPWTPEAAHVWHSKRHAIRAGLERARTVYFIDGDHVLRGEQAHVPKLQALAPGAGAYGGAPLLGRLRFTMACGLLSAQVNARALDAAAAHMGLPDWRPLRWWGDWLYTVTRDEEGRWRDFCPAWDRFAAWSASQAAPHPLVLGDGVALAFAAAACGWTPRLEIAALADVVRAFRHLGAGDWRRRGVDRPASPASPAV